MDREQITGYLRELSAVVAARRRAAPSFLLIGDLLDDFRQQCASLEEKLALVRKTPERIGGAGHTEFNAYLASVAETLCREASLEPPRWT
jgi:hypothetical protein